MRSDRTGLPMLSLVRLRDLRNVWICAGLSQGGKFPPRDNCIQVLIKSRIYAGLAPGGISTQG